jgi:hypothetical protein
MRNLLIIIVLLLLGLNGFGQKSHIDTLEIKKVEMLKRPTPQSGGTKDDIPVFEQQDFVNLIDNIVYDINNNKSLIVKEFDSIEAYGQTFDGNGTIKVYIDSIHISKIVEQIGLSYGRITTTIYFSDNEPIKIIDTEDNFAINDNGTSLNYSELNTVFNTDIYIFDWEADNNKVIIEGKRNLSEGTCGIYEYEGLIDKTKDLLK